MNTPRTSLRTKYYTVFLPHDGTEPHVFRDTVRGVETPEHIRWVLGRHYSQYEGKGFRAPIINPSLLTNSRWAACQKLLAHPKVKMYHSNSHAWVSGSVLTPAMGELWSKTHVDMGFMGNIVLVIPYGVMRDIWFAA